MDASVLNKKNKRLISYYSHNSAINTPAGVIVNCREVGMFFQSYRISKNVTENEGRREV